MKSRSKKNINARQQLDPYWEREAARYDEPLPSREYILQVLEEEGVPVDEKRLAKLLSITRKEAEGFARRIAAMERQGQLLRNRKNQLLVAEKLQLVAGRVEAHPDGFGFLIPDEGGDDYFLNPGEMKQVMHGDRVMARPGGMDRRGRREASIVEVLERAQQRIVGRLMKERGIWFVVPSDKRISHDLLIEPGGRAQAKEGQIVTAELVSQPGRYAQPIARIVEVLGDFGDPGMEIEIALRKHDLPHEFSKEAQKLAAKLPKTVRKSDIGPERVDLRHLPFVTIDGETAKDYDDAVYCERQGKGHKLYVAIADVSHYVTPKDALDQAALERGNSVYFPRRVIPMLPEKLSNGLCSLNPDEDRLAMVCEVVINARGELGPYKFYPAVIRSQARLTYTRVAKLLYGLEADVEPVPDALVPHLRALDGVFRALQQARARRGAIDFETIETEMIFDDNGKIERIVPVLRNDAHKLIEECMLAANVCASDFLQQNEHPTLYRVHEGPTPEKLERTREFLKSFGLQLPGGDKPSAKQYAKLLDSIKNRPDIQLLQTVLLRSLQQAMYSPDNEGHFGLAYDAYTHFTSPIRRYPDLLIHRCIKAVLNGTRYQPGDWHDLGTHCSMTERRADEATRDVVNWLKAYYMRDKVGEEFEGSISAVTSFGIFVALDDIYIEGLVHVSELGNDYFRYEQALQELRGDRTGKAYRLADRVRVKVVRVDLEQSRIDFVLADASE